MFILFGTRTINKELGSTNTIYSCKHCNNVSKWTVVRKRLWFTLFFIPTIPLHSEYICMCPICNWGAKVKKKEALEMINEVQVQEEIKPVENEAVQDENIFAE